MLQTIQNDVLSLSIDCLGAEMKSLQTLHQNKEWLWQADPEFWPRTAPVLFPVIGKLSGNQYLYNGDLYPLSQHGFARDRVFEVTESHPEHCKFKLSSDYESRKFYPFDFDLFIGYNLAKNWVWIEYEVVNTGANDMYFSIGGHPGFAMPNWPSTNYFLTFENQENLKPWLLQEGLIGNQSEKSILLKDNTLQVTPTLFENDALVFNQLNSSWIGLQSENKSHEMKLHFEGFPWMGLWSKPGAPFVCIEPWYGHADRVGQVGEISKKPATLQLDPGENFHCRYAIEILTYL